MTIFVSAGHHAEKQGAHHQYFYEYPEAVHWQHCLAYHLGDLADEVPGLVSEVPDGYLRHKVAYVNDRGTARDLAVEVHFNAAVDADGNPVGEGCETLYYPGSAAGQAAAERVQDVLSHYLPPSRGTKEGWYRGDPERGPIFFLQRVPMPALIVEPEFIHRHHVIAAERERVCKVLAGVLREVHADLRKGGL